MSELNLRKSMGVGRAEKLAGLAATGSQSPAQWCSACRTPGLEGRTHLHPNPRPGTATKARKEEVVLDRASGGNNSRFTLNHARVGHEDRGECSS